MAKYSGRAALGPRRCTVAVVAFVSSATAAGGGTTATTSWVNVIDDEFNTAGYLPSHWSRYNLAYSDGAGCATPSHVTVSGGYLNLLLRHESSGVCGSRWYGAGLRAIPRAPTRRNLVLMHQCQHKVVGCPAGTTGSETIQIGWIKLDISS